jgi:hypothetical protein
MNKSRLSAAALVLITGLLSPWAAVAKGVINWGGGYGVQCDDGRFYALDYLLSKGPGFKVEPKLQAAKTVEEVLQLIQFAMVKRNKKMGEDFADYIKFNRSPTELSSRRLWKEGSYPLVKLTDEARVRVPKDCLNADKEMNTFQVVIRRETSGGVVYYADTDNLAKLAATDPLQLSFTYVHEWLRDLTDDPQMLLDVNEFIHSEAFFHLSSNDLRRAFVRLGLTFKKDGPQKNWDFVEMDFLPEDSFEISWDGVVHNSADSGEFEVRFEICDQYRSHHFGGTFHTSCQPLTARQKVKIERSGLVNPTFSQAAIKPVVIQFSGADVLQRIGKMKFFWVVASVYDGDRKLGSETLMEIGATQALEKNEDFFQVSKDVVMSRPPTTGSALKGWGLAGYDGTKIGQIKVQAKYQLVKRPHWSAE